jgi:hypothetical protein
MKTTFITLLITGLCLTTAVADEPEGKVTFEQKKAEILERISVRLSRIQGEKACVEAATSHDALKACKALSRGARKAKQANRERGAQPSM